MADGHTTSSPSTAPLVDRFGRHVTYLRMSVTDRCDLRCTYCMSERMTFMPKKELLSFEELEQIADAFIERGVKKIRISGGEPLVRRDILTIFQKLGSKLGSGLETLSMTTNATLLDKYAAPLADAGLHSVNVSIDSLTPDRFHAITRRGNLDQVLRGIQAAKQAGLKVKLNTVVLKDQNVDELPDMISWAHDQGFDMTLIEVMPLGETGEDRFDQYIPLPEVRDRLEQKWTLEDLTPTGEIGGPARYTRVRETSGKLGFITPLTNNFCAGCNRVRVTCTGRIYMCLGQNDCVDLREILRSSDTPGQDLNRALDDALFHKPERHEFDISEPESRPALPRHMSVTGG
ncbi:MAG: GTP 3',8-cyclase MoaA [Ponticaulis sp.]|nr:GTP 3',8-cyclase MoaA [Ponticaulis sp.]